MAKSSLDQLLADLKGLESYGVSSESTELLQKGLSSKSNLVIARAADVCGKLNASSLQADLEKTFARLTEDRVKSDKGCLGKTAIAKALHALNASSETFIVGARITQPEPTWGGQSDAAAELRGVCVMGLAQMAHRKTLEVAAELLADADPSVRLASARAIAAYGKEEGGNLLRLKALLGDKEPDVIAECLNSLAMLSRGTSVEFIARFLDSLEPAIACSAALALGQTRLDDALRRLLDAWPRWSMTRDRHILLQSIALTRLPPAIDFLVRELAESRESVGVEIIEALAIYRHDSAIIDRIRATIAGLKSSVLNSAFEKSLR